MKFFKIKLFTILFFLALWHADFVVAEKREEKNFKPIKIKKNASRERVLPKSGHIHKNFVELFFNNTDSHFKSGFGRVLLYGSYDNKGCELDLFFNNKEASIFASLYVDDGQWVEELYLDHPHKKFSDILFQYLLLEKNKSNTITKAAFVAESEESKYIIARDARQLDVGFYVKGNVEAYCSFDLASAEFFDGQQE